MNRILWMAVVVLLFAACKKPQESLESRLKKADVIELTFYNEGKNGETISIQEAAMLDSLSKIVSGTPSEALKCGYDGEIRYKKGDSLIFSGEFNLRPECGHIAFDEGEKTQFHKLSAQPMATLVRLKAAQEGTKLEQLSWFLGRWTQTEGPDLVSFEEWKRASKELFKGAAWTLYHTDTVHQETIDLALEGEDIYYIPTVPENKGPVRFKMTSLTDRSVVFENPAHDFPQKITYEARGDSMLFATISGMVKGKEMSKEFPLKRADR